MEKSFAMWRLLSRLDDPPLVVSPSPIGAGRLNVTAIGAGRSKLNIRIGGYLPTALNMRFGQGPH
jgi:hypothetical protein